MFVSIELLFDFFRKKKSWEEILPEKRIQKCLVVPKGATTLKIVFSGWGEIPDVVQKFIDKLQSKGFATLAYSFPRAILANDANTVPEIFKTIQEDVRTDIEDNLKNYNFCDVEIVGLSLGAVIACMVANDNTSISKVSLIVPGDSLASSLWHGIRTQRLRKIYEQSGLTKEKLNELWSDLAPINNINYLENKKLFIAVSKADVVIPYQYGLNLSNELRKKYSETEIEDNILLGHYLTIGKHLFFSRKLYR